MNAARKILVLLFALIISLNCFGGIPKARYKALPDKDLFIPYISNHPIDAVNPQIKHAIIGIHGAGSGTFSIFRACHTNVKKSGLNDKVLVLAPTFLIGRYEESLEEDNVLYWPGRYLVWTWGLAEARTKNSKEKLRISTFEIMENIIKDLCSRNSFPNLQTITMIGISAGGQFVNRFATSNLVEDKVAKPAGIRIRYIVANPLSYIYMDNRRPAELSKTTFVVPDEKSIELIARIRTIAAKAVKTKQEVNDRLLANPKFLGLEEEDFQKTKKHLMRHLPRYNMYGFGLDKLPLWHQKNGLTVDLIRQQYKKREVIYMVGQLDHDLARMRYEFPQVMLQGKTRVERARLYYAHLIDVYGEQIKKNHTLVIVTGASHGTYSIILKRLAKKHLLELALNSK
jgi:hypothetical protein